MINQDLVLRRTLGLILVSVSLILLLSACGDSPTQPTATISPEMVTTLAEGTPSPSAQSKYTSTIQPSPGPELRSIPLASNDDWIRGPDDATVTLLVYGDFQSPNTALLVEQIEILLARYPDELQYVYRIYPLLPVNNKSSLAGEAAISAASQGYFWEMHDLLFRDYDAWSNLSPEEFMAWLPNAVADTNIDPNQLEANLASRIFKPDMELAYTTGIESGIPGVPLLLINQAPYKLFIDPLNLEAAVSLEMLNTRQFEEYPPTVIDPSKEYYAHLQLNIGELVIQLFPESAPLAVNSFIFLAEQDWFDETGFHKVVPGLMIEGGDPSGTGFGGSGYYFQAEIDPALKFDRAGMVGMSSLSPGVHSSQFFITLDASPAFDGTMTLFGRVIQGMELIDGLVSRDPMTDLLSPADVWIESVTIEVTE